MKDLFKNYHKHKVLSNLGILGISALLAVSVNMFVLSGNTGQALKANVLEATHNKINKIDFEAKANDSSITFTNSKEMQNVTELSFSLAYNYNIIELGEYHSSLELGNISVLENNEGFSTYIMSFVNPVTILKGTTLLELNYVKSGVETAYMNPINVNFTDADGEKYILSTQGIIF